MSLVFEWFASPAWSRLVETLLHSLWQGAILAAGLAVGLRFISRPGPRYRLALLALTGMVAANLVTWAVLQQPGVGARPQSSFPAARTASLAHPNPPIQSSPPVQEGEMSGANATSPKPDHEGDSGQAVPTPGARWSAGLAVIWLVGAVAMLFRAGVQVAGAGRVRRECLPLPEGPARVLLGQIQKSLGMARRIRVVMTDQLTSPAVVGVLVPVLILPVSLITTLSVEQLRFILLHELAHIRRADYLINVLQLLVEALLFFNPAVWWISRQIRWEREACCDAVASELSGAPVEYARTLLHVAERYADPATAAAMAFGDQRTPSRLAERIQRLLSPNHRPRLRLTWGAMLGALVAGGGLLVLSAMGTRLAVAAILTPQQRMDRIEKLLAAQGGEDFMAAGDDGNQNQIAFSGRMRTEDGGKLPQWVYICQLLHAPHNSSFVTSALLNKDGTFKGTCPHGLLTLSAQVPGYAPCVAGPFRMLGTNAVTGLELVLRRGFGVTIQLVDLDSGAPLSNAVVTACLGDPNYNLAERSVTTDFHGVAVMTNCADLPVSLVGSAPGHELIQQSFPALKTNETLRLATRRGLSTSGLVLDKTTGAPIAGASIQVLRQQGASDFSYGWDYRPLRLVTSDRTGHFVTTGLRQDSSYQLGVIVPGHESFRFKGVQAGESNLVARVGPELVVHGRITGNVQALMAGQRAFVGYSILDRENNSSDGYQAEGRLTNGVIYFEFTNRVAGPVALNVVGYEETRTVDAPVADWLVNLTNTPATSAEITPPKMREVVVRLKSSDGGPPQGAVVLTVPADPHNLKGAYMNRRVVVTNGEARLEVPVGANISYAPDKTMLGYWFESNFNWTNVMPGAGAVVIEVPAIPAGVIAAQARNADGSPAGGLSFSIIVRKQAPAVGNPNIMNFDQGDSFSGSDPRHYISPPLPLGGTYEIVGWRGNSFCASGPIKLTAENPDRSVELQFSPGEDITGRVVDPAGRPIRGVSLTVDGVVEEHSYGLTQAFADARGEFRLVDCSPEIAHYSLTVSRAGMRAENVKVNFHRLPLTVALQPGLKLAGRVVETASGDVIPNAEVRVWTDNQRWPNVTTHTDADGNFEFTTLADVNYQIYVDGANLGMNHDNTFRAGVVTNLLLKVTPFPGSELAVRRR